LETAKKLSSSTHTESLPASLRLPTSLLQLFLQSFQQLLPVLLLLQDLFEAVASQQRQQLCQQLGGWGHCVPLMLLLRLQRLLAMWWHCMTCWW
jgi:hypothetical protein